MDSVGAVLRVLTPVLALVILGVGIPQVVRLWWSVAAEVRIKNYALLFWVFVALEGTLESLYLHLVPGPRTILTFGGMVFTALGYLMPERYRQYPRHPRSVAPPPKENT